MTYISSHVVLRTVLVREGFPARRFSREGARGRIVLLESFGLLPVDPTPDRRSTNPTAEVHGPGLIGLLN